MTEISAALDAALEGGPERHRRRSPSRRSCPSASASRACSTPTRWSEDGLLANWEQEGLGADGVVTGMGTIAGRPVALMANDPAVKAGSWGPKTVEKILRIQERALRDQVPMIYLVDSAGARITDQVRMFPGRRGAGRIFHNQVRMSGQVPQVCLLFGPSAAGGAYIPAFCDVVIMRDGNASMYLGSPRMAQMVIGEEVTLEEMGGARMHTSKSGCGHFLAKTDEDAIDLAQAATSPTCRPTGARRPPPAPPAEPGSQATRLRGRPRPTRSPPSTSRDLIDSVVDNGSFLEVSDALGEGAGRRLRPSRRPGDRDRRQPAEGQGRRAVRRLGRQGRPIHLDLQRLQRPAAVPRRRARLHDRQGRRAPGHHPPRRQDDQRRQRGDGAEDLGDRPQGLRRRASTRWPARPSSPTPASPFRRPRSR